MVPVLSKTTVSIEAACSMKLPPLTSTPSLARREIAADIAVAVESFKPQEKSIKSILSTRCRSWVTKYTTAAAIKDTGTKEVAM